MRTVRETHAHFFTRFPIRLYERSWRCGGGRGGDGEWLPALHAHRRWCIYLYIPPPFIMSDWDPRWSSSPPLSPPSASHDEAPSSDAPAAESRDDSPPLASLQAAAAPPATAVTSHGGSSPMSHLNTYIKEYLVQLGLSDLASLFMEEAEKNADIPPVPFVQMWFQLESQMIPCSPPS
ncbi:hypothetical protein NL676_026000 [Syzygium grande]|nr:hypothetical protein NL676_026000 [Syzygium grande]